MLMVRTKGSPKLTLDILSLLLSSPAGRKRKLQKETAELHHKVNIPSQEGRSFLAISIKDCSKVVAKTDTENMDTKINYSLQTLLLTFL